MAQRNTAELLAGAVVLVAAVGFLSYAVANTGRVQLGGYPLHARFTAIDGLAVGADVRVAGVKVGSVASAHVDPQSFQADVVFTVAEAIKLPKDSSAAVTSDGLLGGKYLQLQPGGEEEMIPPGGTLSITQPSINIEQLLGRFIFSMGNLGSAAKPGEPAKPAEAPK
jgi:phospholipid/cholesterol/gamma-HCH transport system substrate-binding protein